MPPNFHVFSCRSNNAKRQDGQTALTYALREGRKDLVKLLIIKGADIHEKAIFGNTLLMLSVMYDQPEIAKLLISRGADVNMENDQGDTPLIMASAKGQKEMIELLLAKGADINHKGRHGQTALLAALSNGRKETADFLITKGAVADVDVKGPGGETPLMHASQWGQKDAVELLMSKGANVNAKDYDGRTPLMFTAMHGEKRTAPDSEGNIPPQYYAELAYRKQIGEFLIRKGADVNARDYDGKTPLIYAAMNGLKEIAELFISKGAFVDAEDEQGNTPLTYAVKNKDAEIERLIIAGSKGELPAAVMAESHVPVEVYEELQAAKETLVNFFDYLHDGQYDKAVTLFEPCEEGPGIHQSSWEGLASFSLRENRDGKSKVLTRYCEAVGTCLKVRILDVRRIDSGKYRLKVQFLKDDGEVFVLGPCCGEPEPVSPQKEFIYFIHRIDEVYKVRTPPLYRP